MTVSGGARVEYLSEPYYESLIAEARGQAPAPSTEAMCDAWLAPLPTRGRSRGNGLAILFDPDDRDAPSSAKTIRHILRLARSNGIEASVIGPGDLPRLPEFGALWIRCHTSPRNFTYAFARLAEHLGLPVLDDSRAIRLCGNKIYLAERLAAHEIAMPQSVIVTAATRIDDLEAVLSYPMVVKVPDGSFSRSVAKADNRNVLKLILSEMLFKSHLILAQEYMPTSFDWRIGLLEGEPLFACQYRMAQGHWQIIKHRPGQTSLEGPFRSVPLARVPADVLSLSVTASTAMGNGLHGVDLKQADRGVFVIEVNDNPNIDRGVEDRAEGALPWLRILGWFREQMVGAASTLPLIAGSVQPL
jgi:glutathione synthase/RimK-type ligase-like ATP-grasp enzyme